MLEFGESVAMSSATIRLSAKTQLTNRKLSIELPVKMTLNFSASR
jgi:hypothetical protein